MTDQQQTNTPDLYLYAKVSDGRKDRIGSRIGVAFKHKNGVGYNILLDAQPIPVDGRIQLVAFDGSENQQS